MTNEYDNSRRDERSHQLARLGWLLHACGVALLLLGAAVYYAVFYAPISASEQALAQRVTALTTILDQANGVSGELAEINKQLDQVRQRATEVRERIPDDDNAGEYLRYLSEVAADSGVVVRNFSRLDTQHNASFSQADIRVECEGTYESICRFLDGLERIPRVARVVLLEISAASARQQCPLQMDVRLYYGLRRATHVPKTTLQWPARPSLRRSGSGSMSASTSPRHEGGRYG